MKKQILLVGVVLTPILSTPIQILSAESQVQLNQKTIINDIAQLEKYIVVENNQYVLTTPRDILVNPVLREQMLLSMNQSNTYIRENNFVINQQSKIAHSRHEVRSFGVTKVEVNWWGLNIFLNKNDANRIIGAGVAGATAVIGNYAYPALAAIAGYLVGSYAHVNSGINIHYNWVRGIDLFAWQ